MGIFAINQALDRPEVHLDICQSVDINKMNYLINATNNYNETLYKIITDHNVNSLVKEEIVNTINRMSYWEQHKLIALDPSRILIRLQYKLSVFLKEEQSYVNIKLHRSCDRIIVSNNTKSVLSEAKAKVLDCFIKNNMEMFPVPHPERIAGSLNEDDQINYFCYTNDVSLVVPHSVNDEENTLKYNTAPYLQALRIALYNTYFQVIFYALAGTFFAFFYFYRKTSFDQTTELSSSASNMNPLLGFIFKKTFVLDKMKLDFLPEFFYSLTSPDETLEEEHVSCYDALTMEQRKAYTLKCSLHPNLMDDTRETPLYIQQLLTNESQFRSFHYYGFARTARTQEETIQYYYKPSITRALSTVFHAPRSILLPRLTIRVVSLLIALLQVVFSPLFKDMQQTFLLSIVLILFFASLDVMMTLIEVSTTFVILTDQRIYIGNFVLPYFSVGHFLYYDDIDRVQLDDSLMLKFQLSPHFFVRHFMQNGPFLIFPKFFLPLFLKCYNAVHLKSLSTPWTYWAKQFYPFYYSYEGGDAECIVRLLEEKLGLTHDDLIQENTDRQNDDHIDAGTVAEIPTVDLSTTEAIIVEE